MTTVTKITRDDTQPLGMREEQVPVKVGDVVGFKCDVEQYGKVVAIDGDWLTLEGNFHGEYIGGQTSTRETADRCWIDG